MRAMSILIVTGLIGCNTTGSFPTHINQPRALQLLSIRPGITTHDEIIKILGNPDRESQSEFSDSIQLEYDLVSLPHLNQKIASVTIAVEPKSRIVHSYFHSPFKGEVLRFSDMKKIFPKAKFAEKPVDLQKLHHIPATAFFEDAEAGIKFEYRKSDDTVFGYNVSKAALPQDQVSK